MDLSQQELPLTAYFARGRARTDKNRPTAPRASKRRRSDVHCSIDITSPSNSNADQPKLQPTTLQLPTPSTSSRKRVRSGRCEGLPHGTRLGDSTKRNTTLPGERNITHLEFEPTPSKLPSSLRKGAEDVIPELSSVPFLATGQRKAAKPVTRTKPHPSRRPSIYTEAAIGTPRPLSGERSGPIHGINDHSPLMRPGCHSPSKSSQVTPCVVFQSLARSTASSSGSSGPFCACKKDTAFVPRDNVPAPSEQCFQLETSHNQSSDGHVIPMIPAPSSQSQYLLHPDATPRRRQFYRRVEDVISSQTQEEAELISPSPLEPVATSRRDALCENVLRLYPGCGEHESQRIHTIGSSPIGSSSNSPASISLSFTAENALGELAFKSSDPSGCRILAPCGTPRSNIKSLRGFARQDLIENVSPECMEDSLTEPESDPDMPQLGIKNKISILDMPSREMDQVSRHSQAPRNKCPAARGFDGDKLPDTGGDSATEAESDTEILHCIAEIDKKRCHENRSKESKKVTPPPLVISPLVSPAKSRIGTVPSIINFPQFSIREDAGSSVSGVPYLSSMEHPRASSESLPSAVRDFVRMFAGDESYPTDFPDSLRI